MIFDSSTLVVIVLGLQHYRSKIMKKKRSLSGVKPTGQIHIGNYFGAIKRFVEHQDVYENFKFVANYHAMTDRLDAKMLRKESFDVVRAYLACGLDPTKTVLFLQSDVPLLGELTWILNCLMQMSQLQRAHAFKAAIDAKKSITVGLFDYPVLMAADILMYGSHVVPVGQDQKQHVEYARDLAEKFNEVFGETFVIPEPLIQDEVAVVLGIDGRKMSKSYGNTISLFEDAATLKKKVMAIMTDSKDVAERKNPEQDLVFAFHKLFAGNKLPKIEKGYREGGLSYRDSKEMLFEFMEEFIAPLREKFANISDDEVLAVLEDGGKKARKISEKMMVKVKTACGLLLK